MLVVVGGPEKYIDAQVKAGGPLMDVIKRFAEAAPLDGQPERILL
jgi:hypothetical protein